MKVLLSWLQRFAPFEGDPVALGDELSDLGLAVESLDHVGEGLEGIVVAEVLGLRPHPDADRVQLVDVDRGDGEALQVVCGAFNMAVGDRVPLATVGTTMPGGMEIGRRKLRGEASDGMLCSAAELGLGTDHSGILLLGPDAAVGTPVAEALGLGPDVLYDLEVNPNRPDALSVAGVARDLAARLRLPFAIPEPVVHEAGGPAAAERIGVEVVDADLCGRFVARVLRGVEVGPSPAWLASRLRACGIRPINNVVDASNLVMLELGQPNHAFDLRTVAGGALRVRWATEGEVLTTLDGVERRLTSADGVVADGSDRVISLAGVMGGASTEISASTTDVLLEAAWWQPMAVARTSKRLGLRSEASMRFERGADPEVIDLALARLAEVLQDTGPGELAAGAVEARGDLPRPTQVRVRTDRINALLGTSLSTDEMAGLLEPIGFRCEPAPEAGPEAPLAPGAHGGVGPAGDVQLVTVPSFRPDTATETDVAEEVARHHGYRRIPTRVPRLAQVGSLSTRQVERRLVRQVLVGLGVDEAMPMPFVSPDALARASCPDGAVAITNPMAAEESVLRTSLRPGLLSTVAYNVSHRARGVRLFEVGKVFLAPEAGHGLPHEPEVLGVALAGSDATAAVETWRVLADALWVGDVSLDQVPVPGLHPTRCAWLVADGRRLGAVGEVDPAVLGSYDIAERVAWLEVDLDALLARPRPAPRFRAISRYPSSDADLAFEVPEDVSAAAVEAVIVEAAGELLAGVQLFDVFRGGNLGHGMRSLAFTLRVQAPDRTLTDDDVAVVTGRVVEALGERFGARLRS